MITAPEREASWPIASSRNGCVFPPTLRRSGVMGPAPFPAAPGAADNTERRADGRLGSSCRLHQVRQPPQSERFVGIPAVVFGTVLEQEPPRPGKRKRRLFEVERPPD